MVQNPALHHLHKRKRKQRTGRLVESLDRLLIVVAVVTPLTVLPQVFDVFNGNISGVSILTWTAAAVLSVPWLAYAIVHRETPHIITSALLLLFDSMVVVGILLHS